MRALIIEDDAGLAAALRAALQEEGYDVDMADNGADGLFWAEQGIHDVMVLDVMLPEMDGWTLLGRVRAAGIEIPVLFLTARDAVADRVRGLDSGADDYMLKPFSTSELLARLRVLLRRQFGVGADVVAFGAIRLDVRRHEVCVGEAPVNLTPKEYDLLEFFVRNGGRILYREQIFNRVWGFDAEAGPSVVDVYVHHLRRKLAETGAREGIHTIRGIGFMLTGA